MSIDKVKLVLEMQRLGYVVTEENYEDMIKAYATLQANKKIDVKQLPEPAAKKASPQKKSSEDFTHFPEYSGTIHQATVVSPSSKFRRIDSNTIEAQIELDVRLAQDINQISFTCNKDILEQMGIKANRRNDYSMIVDDVKMEPMVRSGLEKISSSLRDGTKQARYKRDAVIAIVLFTNKNVGSKDGNDKHTWSMTAITNPKLNPASVISTVVKPIAPTAPVVVPAATTVQVANGLTKLVGFTAVISKTDPLIVNDSWLIANGYNPSIDITAKNQEDLRNRVVEILVNRQFPTLNWVNQQTEKFLTYDFEELANKQTIDIKTICDREHNLLIKRKAKENGTLANALGLVLVEDMGVNFRIECFGFISRIHILRYIEGMPTCFMKQFDSYKIDKKILLRFPFSW
jgi:hypothetical protein